MTEREYCFKNYSPQSGLPMWNTVEEKYAWVKCSCSGWMDWRIKILSVWIFSFSVCQSSWMVFKWGQFKFHFELLVVMENVSFVVHMIYCLRSDSRIVPAQFVVKWVFYIDKCDSNSNFIFDFFYRLWVYSKSLCKEEA